MDRAAAVLRDDEELREHWRHRSVKARQLEGTPSQFAKPDINGWTVRWRKQRCSVSTLSWKPGLVWSSATCSKDNRMTTEPGKAGYAQKDVVFSWICERGCCWRLCLMFSWATSDLRWNMKTKLIWNFFFLHVLWNSNITLILISNRSCQFDFDSF